MIAVSVDVGQGGDPDILRQRALEAGAVESEVVDARSEMAEDFVLPAIYANALLRGEVPARLGALATCDRQHLVAAARRHGARRGRPRLHGQGERPGEVRGRDEVPRPRSRDRWPRCASGG